MKVQAGRMNKNSVRTVIKYTLIQMVDLALLVVVLLVLRQWFDISFWLTAVLIILWIIKDIALFPLLRGSYEGVSEKHPMIGTRGFARDRLEPSGYVWVNGELWHAEMTKETEPIDAGEPLRVLDVRGLTLVVEPERKD